jgi:hypothetical protein
MPLDKTGMSRQNKEVYSRRNWLKTVGSLGVVGVSAGIAGCSDSDSGTTSPSDGDTDADGDEDPSTDDSTATQTDTTGETTTDQDTEPTSSPGGTETEEDASEPATVQTAISLKVRETGSNIGSFEKLISRFESLELVMENGTSATIDDSTQDITLTDLGAGGSVDIANTFLPTGEYTEAQLSFPVQSGTLTDGSTAEFSGTDSVSRQDADNPVTIDSSTSELILTVALVRIGGDGPWTYTLGWGVQ